MNEALRRARILALLSLGGVFAVQRPRDADPGMVTDKDSGEPLFDIERIGDVSDAKILGVDEYATIPQSTWDRLDHARIERLLPKQPAASEPPKPQVQGSREMARRRRQLERQR